MRWRRFHQTRASLGAVSKFSNGIEEDDNVMTEISPDSHVIGRLVDGVVGVFPWHLGV